MYFQDAAARRPQLPDWNVITKDMPWADIQQIGQQRRQEILAVEQMVAKELGVKGVRYPATYPLESYVGITFNINPVRGQCNYASDDDGHDFTIPVDDFDTLKLERLKARLRWDRHFEVDVGGVSHNLESGVMHLRVSVDIGEVKTVLKYQIAGTYEELKKQGLVTKVRDSYEPAPDIVLSEPRTRTTYWPRGFLGRRLEERQETIYQASRRTIKPVEATISVSADGSVSVEERFLQNENVRTALDAIVEDLFGLDLKPRIPVA